MNETRTGVEPEPFGGVTLRMLHYATQEFLWMAGGLTKRQERRALKVWRDIRSGKPSRRAARSGDRDADGTQPEET